MSNSFGTDILIQAPDPKTASAFYVQELGFRITAETPRLISVHGSHINLFIEQGPALGPVLELTVPNVEEAKRRLIKKGCEIVKGRTGLPSLLREGPVWVDLQPDRLSACRSVHLSHGHGRGASFTRTSSIEA
jgi:catechol 2,3-dioxygenase-like lactoylglutathione lyase family enzyme